MKDTTYTIFFEIYGKKMKAEVKAKNEEYAKQAIRDKIIFHKIEDHEVNSMIGKMFEHLGIK